MYVLYICSLSEVGKRFSLQLRPMSVPDISNFESYEYLLATMKRGMSPLKREVYSPILSTGAAGP